MMHSAADTGVLPLPLFAANTTQPRIANTSRRNPNSRSMQILPLTVETTLHSEECP